MIKDFIIIVICEVLKNKKAHSEGRKKFGVGPNDQKPMCVLASIKNPVYLFGTIIQALTYDFIPKSYLITNFSGRRHFAIDKAKGVSR